MKTFLSQFTVELCKKWLKPFMVVALLGGISSNDMQAQGATHIYTDFNGFWSSSNGSNTVRPNNRHNLLGFKYDGVVYSTGVNDALLNANSVSYTPAFFQSMPMEVMPGNSGPSNSSNFMVLGNAVDGNPNAKVVANVATLTAKSVLIDGVNGLDIGTGITNVQPGIQIQFPINCVNPQAVTDNIPDFLFSQIADPTGTGVDVLTFRDANGNQVGSSFSINFNNTVSLGAYDMDLFTLQPNTPYNTAVPIGIGTAGNSWRDIRLIAVKFANLGINASNASQIKAVRIVTGGNSDPAFYAYNPQSLSMNLEFTWTGNTNTEWNNAANWICGVTPSSTDNVAVRQSSVGSYPVIASESTVEVKNLEIQNGAKLTLGQDAILNINGTSNLQGGIDASNAELSFGGTSNHTIGANSIFGGAVKNLRVKGSGTVTVNAPIDITGVLTVYSGDFNANGNVTLKSNANTTAVVAPVGGVIHGEFTVEQFIPARRAFRFITSPVTGGSIYSNWQENGSQNPGFGTDITGQGGAANGFDPSISNNPSLYRYNNAQSGNGWVAVTNTTTTPLTAGEPYRILVRGDRTIDQTDNDAIPTNTVLRSKGTLNSGVLYVNDLTPVDQYFSLVGNPYQAKVDMEIALHNSTGLDKNFYYVWDPTINTRGGYVTVDVINRSNSNLSSVANSYVQPGQAFFVKTDLSNGTPQLLFNESYKTDETTTENIWRSASDASVAGQIRMTLYEATAWAENAPAADGFVINFGSGFSNGLDSRDAKKPSNQDENAGMLVDGTLVSYQSRDLPTASDVIPIKHTQYRHNQYVYRADVTDLPGATAYLHDKYTNEMHELPQNETTSVAFSVDPSIAGSVDENRFEILFSALSVDGMDFNTQVAVYPNPNNGSEFSVNLADASAHKVRIHNILGQEFGSRAQQNGNQIVVTPNHPLSSGMYTVTIEGAKGVSTKKLIVK